MYKVTFSHEEESKKHVVEEVMDANKESKAMISVGASKIVAECTDGQAVGSLTSKLCQSGKYTLSSVKKYDIHIPALSVGQVYAE